MSSIKELGAVLVSCRGKDTVMPGLGNNKLAGQGLYRVRTVTQSLHGCYRERL